MNSILNPYISFKDNAREALEFYKGVFGGELTTSTFKEGGTQGMAPDEENLIMHGMLVAANGITLMCSDTPKSMKYEDGARISVSLSGDNEEELRGYYDKLLEGGAAPMPIATAPWGDTFGMLTDKYGINWLVNIAGPKQEK